MSSTSPPAAAAGNTKSSSRGSFELKFSNSSAALLSPDSETSQSDQALLESHSAALRVHHARLAGYSDRWAICFLLMLSLLLAWAIGHFQASPALLLLLGVAALAIGRGRWQQVVEGAELEAELKVRRKVKTQLRGETAEWLNFLLNRWWMTCNDTVLAFTKEYVEPLLADLLPPGIDKIEVVEVDFGEQTPIISNLRFTELPCSGGVGMERDTCTLIMNFDLTLPSPDSQIVLRVRVGGKNVGTNHLVYVDSLYVSGHIQALVVLDSHAPFPNVIKVAATFPSKPDIWFSVKVLKGLKITNIPILKKLIHSIVMDMFTTLLVDPGKLMLNFDPSPPLPGAGIEGCAENRHAQGVLTLTVTGHTPQSGKGAYEGDPRRWVSLRLGERKYQEQLVLESGQWKGTFSFLTFDLQQDVLVLKVKLRRVLYSNTLATHSVGLASLGFISPEGEESETERSVSVSNSVMSLQMNLCYSPLPSFSLHARNNFPPITKDSVCGVLCVHVHSGHELMSADDDGFSDPYCVVKVNKEKILRTHHISNSLSPCWERGVEVFVSDITQVVLTFLVLDWDGPLVGDDLLGVAKLKLPDDSSELIQHKLPLVGDTDSSQAQSLGHITVSVIFRPVAAVKRSSPQCQVSLADGAPPLSVGGVAAGKKSQGIKMRNLKSKRKDYYSDQAHMSQGMLELKLLRGLDLVPKDSNGLSDPYVVVKYGSQVMFRSKVIKKSLNPEWNETATLTPPTADDIIHVECWDKDIFSDDFMGSMQFTDRDLQIFQDKEQWCRLEHVKHGQLLIRLLLTEGVESSRWSHLDEASRQFGDVRMLEDQQDMRGTILMRHSSQHSLTSSSSRLSSNVPEDSSDGGHLSSTLTSPNPSTDGARRFPATKSVAQIPVVSHHPRPPEQPQPVPHSSSTEDSLSGQQHHPPLRRRHTLSHQARPPDQDILLVPRYPETTADIQWALNRAGGKHHTSERSGLKEKQIKFFHNVSGQVIEATGLKGELDHMELYIKVRLNTRPSYQRQHKFGRGPVVHKTRVLRGSHTPQWREDFMVKESPVASDSLLTLDLKSGSKVNIGTYAITLDKFFDGNFKITRSLDIGNDAKVRVKLSRQSQS